MQTRRLIYHLEILFILLPFVHSARYTISNAPSIPTADSIQIFYLEAPFPFNTPQNIIQAAGTNFNRYGVTHSGLGIWDTVTNDKYSIEFVSSDYTGSLLPVIKDGILQWNNTGKIVVTYPLIETDWLNSRLIATTTGNAYTQLINYLSGTTKYKYYQPVNLFFVNNSLANASSAGNGGGDIQSNDLLSVGSLIIPACDSFAFVDDLINQLSNYGTTLGAFLQIYASSFTYFSKINAPARTVPSNSAEVHAWFNDLYNCYYDVFQQVVANGEGAAYWFEAIKGCYTGPFAYLYYSPTEVYNVTLSNFSSYYSTPSESQYIYELPVSGPGANESLQVIDYLIITFVGLAIFGGIAYFINRIFGKQKRRRVSFEGERVAARTVETIAGSFLEDDHEDKTYFHGRKSFNSSLFSRLSGSFKSNNNIGNKTPVNVNPMQDSFFGSNNSSLEKPLTGGYASGEY